MYLSNSNKTKTELQELLKNNINYNKLKKNTLLELITEKYGLDHNYNLKKITKKEIIKILNQNNNKYNDKYNKYNKLKINELKKILKSKFYCKYGPLKKIQLIKLLIDHDNGIKNYENFTKRLLQSELKIENNKLKKISKYIEIKKTGSRDELINLLRKINEFNKIDLNLNTNLNLKRYTDILNKNVLKDLNKKYGFLSLKYLSKQKLIQFFKIKFNPCNFTAKDLMYLLEQNSLYNAKMIQNNFDIILKIKYNIVLYDDIKYLILKYICN